MATAQGFLEANVVYDADEAYENQDVLEQKLDDVNDKKLKMFPNGGNYK